MLTPSILHCPSAFVDLVLLNLASTEVMNGAGRVRLERASSHYLDTQVTK